MKMKLMYAIICIFSVHVCLSQEPILYTTDACGETYTGVINVIQNVI
jgi:hypothetical protein